jgi:hypothetical protein
LHLRQDAQLHEGVDPADCTQHWLPLFYLHIRIDTGQIWQNKTAEHK